MTATAGVFEGSCQCGRIRYRAEEPFADLLHCHCTDCQKSHGAAFTTGLGVRREKFTVTQGRDGLSSHRTESGTKRSFCSNCGSKIVVENERWDAVYVPAGTLDTPLQRKPELHMYVRSKVAWFEINDDLPQHETDPD